MHPKLKKAIEIALLDPGIDMQYYGYFNLYLKFKERNDLPTCAVNVDEVGMNFFYNTEFLDKLQQKEVNFILIHEDLHLLWEHNRRTALGYFNSELANIAQDMIINHIIWRDVHKDYVSIPKDSKGNNMPLFLPKEYKGDLIFEDLYKWLEKEEEEWRDKKSKNPNHGKNKPEFGPYGQNPMGSGYPDIEMSSLEKLFEGLGKSKVYLDVHIPDIVSDEMKNQIKNDIKEKLKNRGLLKGNVIRTIGDLKPQKKNYLSYIQRVISNEMIGKVSRKTIVKPNRRSIPGLKGKKKETTKINVILDTSGSMSSEFDKVMSYIYNKDVEINLIQCDTEVRSVQSIKSSNNKKKLDKLEIKGLGGTIIQPAVNIISERFNNYHTLILTDGYTDTLDLSILKGRVLVISTGREVPISSERSGVKQIIIS